jgi:ABC-type sugar transport system ATPase subunit
MGLELRNLSKRYGETWVLHPLSLDVAGGHFLELMSI